MKDTKKPLVDEALAGASKNGSSEISGLKTRIERFETAKSNQTKILNYFRHSANSNYPKSTIEKLKNDIGGCGNYLVFHQYSNESVRLGKASFCKKHFLCQLCAIRRGAKQVESYMRKLEVLQAENQNLKPYLLTYTVRNGENLAERFKHLTGSLKRLMVKRRDYLNKGVPSQFGEVLGGVYSVELTKSDKGWHPHCHMVVLLEPDHQIDFPCQDKPKKHSRDEWSMLSPKEKKIEQQKWIAYGKAAKASGLSKEWKKITKDSDIVDLRPIDGDPAMGFVEVFKYALKFSDLSPEDNVNAYFELLNKNGSMPRFTGSFGLLWGVKIPDSLLDETFDDLPYLELFYKYTKSGYSLASAIQKKSKNEQVREVEERFSLEEVIGEPLQVQKAQSVNTSVLIANEKERLQCKKELLELEKERGCPVVFDNQWNVVELLAPMTKEELIDDAVNQVCRSICKIKRKFKIYKLLQCNKELLKTIIGRINNYTVITYLERFSMFNMSLALKASMLVNEVSSKEDFKNILEASCESKEVISIDKVVYRFEDTSLLCCDGNSVNARAVGADIKEFY